MIISTDSRQSYFHSIGFPKFCLQTKNSRIYLLMQNCSIDLYHLSVPDFLMKLEQKGFPAFETVRRSRQKVQATYPDLAATGAVGAFRARNEKVYRKFAKSEV